MTTPGDYSRDEVTLDLSVFGAEDMACLARLLIGHLDSDGPDEAWSAVFHPDTREMYLCDEHGHRLAVEVP